MSYQPPQWPPPAPPQQYPPPNHPPPIPPGYQQPVPSSSPQKKWYQSNAGIIALLVLFFPVGLFFMWKYAAWSKGAKWTITGIIIFCVVANGIASAQAKPPENIVQSTVTSTPEQKPTPTPKLTPTPKPVDKLNVTVTSLNVKLVDGKYRYYFDVRNHDTRPFNGSATIGLYNNKQQTSVGPEETFDTTKPMEPTLGSMVYFDINTGPPSVHGEYGITHFKFTIKVNNQQVNSGDGLIPDKQF